MSTTTNPTRTTARSDRGRIDATSPLRHVADVAAELAGASGTVGITRGFDRSSRDRAAALQQLLRESGIAPAQLTPVSMNSRLCAGETVGDVAVVVNLIAGESRQAHRMAATLRVPLLHLTAENSDQQREDVIGVTDASGRRDVALTHIAVRPSAPGSGKLGVTLDDEHQTVEGGNLDVTARGAELFAELRGSDYAVRSENVRQITIESFDGQFQLVRDELPIADLEDGPLHLAAEPAGLTVHAISVDAARAA